METTVYGDLLFFVNFCMDFQCLFLTAKLLRCRFSVWRGALLSAFGALYACAALFLTVSGVVAFLADLAVCFLMCLGTFAARGERPRRVLLSFAAYFCVSAAVGGVMSALGAWLARLPLPDLPAGEGGTGAFFLLAAAGGTATFLWAGFCRRRANGTRGTLRVRVGERERTFTCLVDTANFLRDPVSGRAVVLLTPRAARSLFPPALLAGIPAIADLPPPLARRVRLVPAATATGKSMLVALMPDEAELDIGRGAQQTELLLAPAVGAFADCEALLPADLIT